MYFGFEDDPAVIFADIHEDGDTLYPGTGKAGDTGRGAAAGTKLNLPLMAGSGDRAFQGAWARVLEHMERFEPQFLLLQCGADSIEGDPITHLRFSPAMHGRAAQDLVQLAGRLGHGRVLALGGGGYNRSNLGKAWSEVVAGLA